MFYLELWAAVLWVDVSVLGTCLGESMGSILIAVEAWVEVGEDGVRPTLRYEFGWMFHSSRLYYTYPENTSRRLYVWIDVLCGDAWVKVRALTHTLLSNIDAERQFKYSKRLFVLLDTERLLITSILAPARLLFPCNIWSVLLPNMCTFTRPSTPTSTHASG